MNSELMIENLSFKDILKNINFNLESGTICALMGKTGSGKTLLLKSIFGLVECEGSISVNGTLVTKQNIETTRKNLGIYLGINNLESKSVFLNLFDPLSNLNYPEEDAKKKIYDISKKLNIQSLLYKEIDSLSYSQKKIVSFAQSVVHEPSVIIIDELFDSLDINYKNKVISYLKQLKKSVIIFTTNNSENLWFADNLMVIKNGEISVNGSLKELFEDENIFSKNDIKLPFIVDLSYKLKAYNLIDRLIYDTNEMVDEIWQ